MTVLEELAQLLHDLGLGTYDPDDITGTIYLAALPGAPDESLSVTRYGGQESSSLHGHDTLSVQVRCRGTAADVRTGEAAAQAVYDALHGITHRVLSGGTLLELAVCEQGGPVDMGMDPAGRREWAVNLRIDLRRITANRT